uniref:Uncharacterized protein n=1 Tax=Moumouvirus sp. 'Monve' TaxID=1128131 RepID=H2ED23_9VIRU|nr:hypothetical protein mv_R91 [Moumouvirus Monve]
MIIINKSGSVCFTNVLKFIKTMHLDENIMHPRVKLLMRVTLSQKESKKFSREFDFIEGEPRFIFYRLELNNYGELIRIINNHIAISDGILSEDTPKPGEYIGQNVSLINKMTLSFPNFVVVIKEDKIIFKSNTKYLDKTTTQVLNELTKCLVYN